MNWFAAGTAPTNGVELDVMFPAVSYVNEVVTRFGSVSVTRPLVAGSYTNDHVDGVALPYPWVSEVNVPFVYV